MANVTQRKCLAVILLMVTFVSIEAGPLRHPVKLDPFETLAQTLRQQKHLEPEIEPEEYVEYGNDYANYDDDYYQKEQLVPPPEDDLSTATVVWAPPPTFQRGQRNWEALIPDVYRHREDEEDGQSAVEEEAEKQRLLMDTFTDYLWQFNEKEKQQSVKRTQEGQKEVSIGSQQKSPLSSSRLTKPKSNVKNTIEHIKGSNVEADSEDELTGELNKLKALEVNN